MKSATMIGIALIVLGVVALAYQGITYTTQEKVIDIGPIEATATTEKTIPIIVADFMTQPPCFDYCTWIYIGLRPWMIRISITMIAITKRIWINPPMV